MRHRIITALCILAWAAPAYRAAADDTPGGGHRVLWKLDIEGNTQVPKDELQEAILTTPSSHFHLFGWYPGGSREFDPVAFQADQKRIEHLYKRLGYYQATIDQAAVEPCSKEGRVCARLHVDEGQPTHIAAIEVKSGVSDPAISDTEIQTAFGMKVGDLFNHDTYMKAKATVESYLKERSYPKPEVKGEVVYDPKTNDVRISLRVTPGYAARIGSIRFKGLDQIRADDAMARLPIREGTYYDPRQFAEADELLSNLDVFRMIDVQLNPRPSDPHIVDVVYNVREKPLRSLQAGGGIRIENSRQEVRGRAEWINRNYHKYLRTFDLRFEPAFAVLPSVFRPQQSGPLGTTEAVMRQPSFLSPWQDLRVIVGFDADLEQAYRWYGPRVTGNVERRLGKAITVSGGYTFRYLSFYDVNLSAPTPTNGAALPVELIQTPSYRLGFVDQNVRWDNRDDIIEPHVGSLISGTFQESAPFLASGFTYFRAMPELRHYFPMTRRATLAARALYGRIAPLVGHTTPITERFYGGGANDHRGFGYHRLSPLALASDGSTVPVGGNIEVLFSFEERINLFELGDHWMVGALFLDAGDVGGSPSEIDFEHLHYAVGPGLRYDTPLGVIRADIGIRLNRLSDFTDGRPNPDPGQRVAFHVSFGEAF